MDTHSASVLERALAAVGDLLANAGHAVAIVVLGGTAMNLLGFVSRTTRDVDVIASASPDDRAAIGRPDPLPKPLREAVLRVARDFRLAEDWLNTAAASQWDTGLPRGLATRVEWRVYGGLHVGLVGRTDLVFFKLYAAADDVGTTSVHFQDLVALRPTVEELRAAADWIATQDPSPSFRSVVETVIDHAIRLA